MTVDEDYLCFDLKDYSSNEDLSLLRKQFKKAKRIEIDCDGCEAEVHYDNLNSLLQSYCEKINYLQLMNLSRIFQLDCLRYLPITMVQIHCYVKELDESTVLDAEPQKFPNLFEFRELRALTLSGFNLDDNSLSGIDTIKNLNFLDLTDSVIPAVELDRLKKLTTLKHLYLSSCRLDDKSLSGFLMTSKNLQALDINSNPDITDRSMEKLCALPDLRILNVMNLYQITDYYLEEMRSLTALNCQNCPLVREPGLVKLLTLAPNLRYLDVKRCAVSEELLDAALEIVRSRSSKRQLEISVDRPLKNKWNSANSCPLLKITDDTEIDE